MADSKIVIDRKTLFAQVSKTKGFAAKFKLFEELAWLGQKNTGDKQVVFDHADRAAVGFLFAAAMDQLEKSAQKKLKNSCLGKKMARRIWCVVTNLRALEQLVDDLSVWGISPLIVPEDETQLAGEAMINPEQASERLAALHQLSIKENQGIEIVLVTIDSLSQPTPTSQSITQAAYQLKTGDSLNLAEFGKSLETAGFERVGQVFSRGQWAQRGGIVDVFPWQAPHPYRVELFDEEVESLREFDLDSQISRRKLTEIELVLKEPESEKPLSSWIDLENDTVVSLLGAQIESSLVIFEESIEQEGVENFDTACFGSPFGAFNAGDFVLQETRRAGVIHQLKSWGPGTGWLSVLFVANAGEEARIRELMPADALDATHLLRGEITQGFTIPSAKIAVLSSSEIFGRYQTPQARYRRVKEEKSQSSRAQVSLDEIEIGDLVVHTEYGIGKFRGILPNEAGEDGIVIEYQGGTTLRVPLDLSHLIGKYVGLGGGTPALSSLGDGKWSRAKKSAEKSILDYAAQLLRVQAERQTISGISHAQDSHWLWEFENSFLFTETPDQLRAIRDAKSDMESARPMDRLICGDVGFGKTEVAIRAAFKCVTGGKQCAMLVPTTVLAEQHWRNFRERMSDYPVRIELLSRFRTPAQIREALEGMNDGSVDIVIGTHRLVSQDIHFKNLGLIIIDEEQRFGVRHKEKFRDRFRGLDVSTLSATPIPRTLYMALMGVRDMSTIDTPPNNRVPVHTSVCAYDERIIREAIRRELKRGGQVFFLHNRVKSIEMVRKKLEELVPDAKIVVGHGQMEKNELESVMHKFVNGEADILLATTIIESGIDIPNANTILIDRADQFGLADLYQLRGRVGRSGRQAYAVLLLPRGMITVGDARKRVNAIKQYSALGSGFKIAMRDLEIRGAGNLLGTQQSGHIAAVGFEMYCQLLAQSLQKIKGQKLERRVEVLLKADFIAFTEAAFAKNPETVPAFLPAEFMPEARLRIAAYKHLAEVSSNVALKKLSETWRDRFGRFPLAVENLLLVAEIKLHAAFSNISTIEIKDQRLMLTKNGGYIMVDDRRFPRLKETKARQKLDETLKLLQSL